MIAYIFPHAFSLARSSVLAYFRFDEPVDSLEKSENDLVGVSKRGGSCAANNGQPKSPARQQCEANAQSSYRDTLENTAWQNTFVPFKAAGAGAISGGIIGCVLTVEGGCFEGAIPGALTGLFGGAVEGTIQAVSSDISGYRQAKGQLAVALAACQQIP
jgi:hypothetical protein